MLDNEENLSAAPVCCPDRHQFCLRAGYGAFGFRPGESMDQTVRIISRTSELTSRTATEIRGYRATHRPQRSEAGRQRTPHISVRYSWTNCTDIAPSPTPSESFPLEKASASRSGQLGGRYCDAGKSPPEWLLPPRPKAGIPATTCRWRARAPPIRLRLRACEVQRDRRSVLSITLRRARGWL